MFWDRERGRVFWDRECGRVFYDPMGHGCMGAWGTWATGTTVISAMPHAMHPWGYRDYSN